MGATANERGRVQHSCNVPSFLACMMTVILPTMTLAEQYYTSPDGSPYTIGEAMDLALPGDTVVLADGVYDEAIVTVRDGEEGKPITLLGSSDATLNGQVDGKIVTVRHSWISLEDFTVDGETSTADSADSFIDKCVFVWGQEDPAYVRFSGGEAFASIIGFSMKGMTIRNCGGECVRMKHFVTNSEIQSNVISNCGVHDFRFGEGGLNGEGIYVGTSSNQWTAGPDLTANNVVRGNTLTPNGNECVDIKEGAYGNIVENNDCVEQLDPNAGCFGSRGDDNIFRYNTGDNCDGAGIRLGGWEVDGEIYGRNTDVYGNEFTNTGTGVIVARQLPQGIVCGNSCTDGVCDVIGDENIASAWDQPCAGEERVSATNDEESTNSTEEIVPDDGTPVSTSAEREQFEEQEIEDEDVREELEGVEEEFVMDDTVTGSEEDTTSAQEGSVEEAEESSPTSLSDMGGTVTPYVEDDSDASTCQAIAILPSYLSACAETQEGNPVEHMIDDLLSTRWSAEGDGAWMSIELPSSSYVSGIQAAFEDGDLRTQDFDIVVVGDTEVETISQTSSGTTDGLQTFTLEQELLVKTLFVIGNGNSVNEWNSFTEIKVCAGTANVDGGIETVTRKLTDISFNSHIAKDVEGDDSSSYGLEATDKHDTRATEEQQQPGSRQSQLQSPPPQNGATNLRGSRSSNLM